VNKTCVPATKMDKILKQELIALLTTRRCVLDAPREKSWYQRRVLNVLPVKPPVALLQRVTLALRVNTKTKTVQEQNTDVKIVVPEHTASKPNKVLHHRARIVSRDVGRPRPATASVLVQLDALPVTKVHTTRRPHKVPTRVPIVAKASTTMFLPKTPQVLVKIAVPVRTIRQKVPLPRLLVRTAALLNFQPSSLPLPNPVAKIALMVTTKPPLAKTTVI
jgi:hypothetical protein